MSAQQIKATKIDFANEEFGHLVKYIRSSAARGLPLVQQGVHEGGALVCGLGPSIKAPEVLDEIKRRVADGWTVIAIKEAISYLIERGVPVKYSVNMDTTTNELGRVPVYPDVTYCLASSCHPSLYDELLGQGANVQVFHSACGAYDTRAEPGFVLDFPGGQQSVHTGHYEFQATDGLWFSPVCYAKVDEISLYKDAWGNGDVMCGGYTVGNRAVALAQYFGFSPVAFAGLDFGWRPDDNEDYYASFVSAKPLDRTFMNDHGSVDGKPWRTRPDLMASATDLARAIRGGTIEAIGDSLARSLAFHEVTPEEAQRAEAHLKAYGLWNKPGPFPAGGDDLHDAYLRFVSGTV